MANIPGTNGNDVLIGTIGADTFDLTLGGTDSVTGGQGDDVILAGATFDPLDTINGGLGYDRIELLGNYAGGITLSASTLRNVEEIRFGANFDYSLTTHDLTVAAGAVLKIDAYFNGVGHSVTFDGSAETNGSFLYYDGTGSDIVTGGAMGDSFVMSYDGSDQVYGGAGGDTIYAGNAFDVTDVFDGGAGTNDTIYLFDNYNLAITSGMLKNVETMALGGVDATLAISVADGVVAAGANLYVTGGNISGTGSFSFNGLSETDGTFSLSGQHWQRHDFRRPEQRRVLRPEWRL